MKYCFILSLILISYTAYAQNGKQSAIDSILKKLSKTAEDTNKVILLDDLSFAYHLSDPQKGIKYAQQALSLSEQLSWKKGIAKAYAGLGVNYEAESEHIAALNYHLKAIKICEELGLKQDIAGNLADISLIYIAQSDYPNALDYAFKALKLNDPNAKKTKTIIFGNIGNIYLAEKRYSKALEYYSGALKNCEELRDTDGMARYLGNIGIIYDAEKNYSKALEYHSRALKVNQKSGNVNGTQINLANIGYVYNHLNDYPQALKYQLMALKISEESDSKDGIAVNLGNIGETYFAMATDTSGNTKENKLTRSNKKTNLQQAVKYLEKATGLCAEIQFAAPCMEFNQYLSEAYLLLSDYKHAFEKLKQYTAAKDSVFSIENKIKITDLETKREIELKDKDLQLADRQLQIHNLEVEKKSEEHTLYIAGIILLLLVICFAYKKMNNYRKWNQTLLNEQKKNIALIEAQVNRIKIQNGILEEIAHIQAHNVRGPVATILGLAQLFNYENAVDPINAVVIKGIGTITEQLDIAVQDVIKKQNNLK